MTPASFFFLTYFKIIWVALKTKYAKRIYKISYIFILFATLQPIFKNINISPLNKIHSRFSTFWFFLHIIIIHIFTKIFIGVSFYLCIRAGIKVHEQDFPRYFILSYITLYQRKERGQEMLECTVSFKWNNNYYMNVLDYK